MVAPCARFTGVHAGVPMQTAWPRFYSRLAGKFRQTTAVTHATVFIFGNIIYERTKDQVMPITPRLAGR
jgi:hypothetical protein